MGRLTLFRMPEWKAARVVVAPMALLMLAGMVGAALSRDPQARLACNNLHWLAAFIGAALLAFVGYARADRAARPQHRLLLAFLLVYALGQLTWTVLSLLGQPPFPGPPDYLFLAAIPLISVALGRQLTAGKAPAARQSYWLDVLVLSAAGFSLVAVLYFSGIPAPEPLPLTVLTAYPVIGLAAAGIVWLAILVSERLPGPGVFLFAGGLTLNAWLTLLWNLSAVLQQDLPFQPILDALISVSVAAMGLGAALWRFEAQPGAEGDRLNPHTRRYLPVCAIAIAAAAVVATYARADSPAYARLVELVAFGAVVLIAFLRQSVIVGELRDALKLVRRGHDLHEKLLQMQRVETLGMLASGVAHDINNMLLPITVGADVILDEARGNAVVAEQARAVASAAQEMKQLVGRLLGFVRARQECFQELALNEIITDLMPLLGMLARRKVELQFSLAEGLPPVRGDATQLHQVLLNLVVNASEAMPEGGTVRVSTALDGEDIVMLPDGGLGPAQLVQLVVEDSGSGMDEATQSAMFEPFFTTKAGGKGTGLGLATVAGIVRKHSGRIAVDSAPGSGTRISILLPATAAAGHTAA